ncbi:MAG: MerR family transcriptional regulator [Candidatus Marinimicrobia bacterium]|jgi:DNA-binding transcriptional MerR regulator|nr:MerR family transcriptional regulator [Candidatus Neomarinimicrobiota bacterium]|tara:strand:+ start:153 stop:521 length:369 start_codon:yes stop_codon:yes gene_type:complete
MNPDKPQIKKLYYSISEVSKITGLKQYVLRYWETEFSQLKPPKNRAGNRTYRQKDIDVVHKIKELLYKKKFTIVGARKQMETPVIAKDTDVTSESTKSLGLNSDVLDKLKQELKDILCIIKE